jgi:hypothetical protein
MAIAKGSESGNLLSVKLLKFSKGKRVLEFGSGGSTILFAKSCKSLITVESDFSYALKMKVLCQEWKHVDVLWAYIGPTGSYGQPVQDSRLTFYKSYSSYFSVFSTNSIRSVDLVFIDGRFRVAVAMKCFLEIDSEFSLVIDDYFSREEYHSIEVFLGPPSEKINDSAVFHVKEKNQRREWNEYLSKQLEAYIFDFR